MRCRWLAGKFILKSLAQSNQTIFDTYYSLFLNWRYTLKSISVLSIAANSLSNFHQHIIKYIKPQIYERSFESLLFPPPLFILMDNLPICPLTSSNQCLVPWSIISFPITLTSIFLILWLSILMDQSLAFSWFLILYT